MSVRRYIVLRAKAGGEPVSPEGVATMIDRSIAWSYGINGEFLLSSLEEAKEFAEGPDGWTEPEAIDTAEPAVIIQITIDFPSSEVQ